MNAQHTPETRRAPDTRNTPGTPRHAPIAPNAPTVPEASTIPGASTASDAFAVPDASQNHPGPRPAPARGPASRTQGAGHRPAPKPPGPSAAEPRTPRGPNRARSALGRYGESLAARRLTETGLTVLERNWRGGRTGEIDIIARDGDALVIVEVKTRRAGPYEHPMAAVTPAKAERLRTLAERWLQEHGGAPPGGVRIDLVGVLLPDRGAPLVEHARGVA